ncbi:MAG: hypothetical protein R5N76_09435, partial [Cutibacterium granulosum]|nr:hypothetical protein [Cutibacterium granulosum]
ATDKITKVWCWLAIWRKECSPIASCGFNDQEVQWGQVLQPRPDPVMPLLAQVPMDIELRKGGDEGDPIVTAHPESPAAQAIVELAKNLDSRPRGLSGMHLGVSPTNNA